MSNTSEISAYGPFTERRFGRIMVSAAMAHEQETMRVLLANFTPTRAEYKFENNAYEYTGYSSKFAITQIGAIVPQYDVWFHSKVGADGTQKVSSVEFCASLYGTSPGT